MAQINAQVPITHGASLGGQLSGTNKSEFKKTHLLKVTSKEERNDSSMPSNVYNRVAWRIFPADKEQGIGDSFTVALLVKRPQGSRFQLAAEVDGDVGSFSANTKKFLLSGVGGRKQKTPLATFPLQPPNPKVPQGVLVGDLHRAAIDNVMRDIEEVGLHLPERVNPVKFNKGEQGVQVPSATTHQVNIDKTEVVNAATTTSTASHDHQSRAVPIPVAPPVGSSTTEAAKTAFLILHLQALTIARRNREYHVVAGNTAMLVFFETPHRSTSERSWESLANWLLLVSGEDRLFSLGWIQAVAGMMKTACVNFKSVERLYRVINVYYESINPSHHLGADGANWQTSLMGGYVRSLATLIQSLSFSIKRPMLHRVSFNIDSSRQLNFKSKLIMAIGPGQPLIECLETLASIADSQLYDPSVPSLYKRTSPKTLDALGNHLKFSQWETASNGPLHIIVPFGDDSSMLFSRLQTAGTNRDKSSNSAIISYVFNPRSPEKNNETTLLASLCYQLLCLKPQLFEHVATLNDSLQQFSKDVFWRVHRLFILFRSLLSCPYEGETICVLREMDRTKLPERVVTNLLSLATSEDSKFKLVIISGADTAFKIPKIELKQEELDLEAILDHELDHLISKRPGLLSTRSALRAGLLTQQHKSPDLFMGFFDAVTAVVRACLELTIRTAEPISISSITHSSDLMLNTANNIEEIYKAILQRIPAHKRRKMRSVLSWLTLSQLPLEVTELAAVSALEDGIQTIDALHKNAPVDLSGDLQNAFGFIIQIDDHGYPLLPEELRTFLMSGHAKDETSECEGTCVLCVDGELELAQKCLKFLRLYKNEDPCTLITLQDNHPFISYAVRQWAAHYINGKNTISQREEEWSISPDFLDFFQDSKLMSFWASMYTLFQHPGIDYPTGSSLLIAAEVGCLDLVKCLLPLMDTNREEDITTLSRGLVAAISKGDPKIVKSFIGAKAPSSLALHAAASSGQRDLLKCLTTSDGNLEVRDMQGLTQLHCACRSGVLEVVEDLLDARADARAQSSDEEATPLHIACKFGHAAVIRRLKELDNLDLNAKDRFGRTPLYYACKWQQPDAVRALLQGPKGQEIDMYNIDSSSRTTALHHAASEGRLDILKLILDYGYPSKNAAADNLLGMADTSGSTALHYAARDGHFEVAKELIRREKPGDFAASLEDDSRSNLPIHLASKNGHARIVERLLENTALVVEQLCWRAYNEEYSLPIHLAVSYDHVEVVRLLAEAHEKNNVSLDRFDGQQRSPLHLAATMGQIDIARLLVKHGATPDILDYDDATPLLLACHGGHEAVAAFLVGKGADVDIPNDKKIYPSTGTTPLLAAAQLGSVSIMKALKSLKASWTAKDDEGRSALHLAVESPKAGHYVIVKYLVNDGELPPDAKDVAGQTALSLAAEGGHLEIVKFLAQQTPSGVEGADSKGNTPLFHASGAGHLSVVSFLLGNANPGVNSNDLSILNHLDRGPLWAAVSNNQTEIVKLLLQQGADPKTVEKDHLFTLLHCAVSENSLGVMNLLLAADGIDGHARDDKDRTPIFMAAYQGKTEMVRKLIDAGWEGNFPQYRWGWHPFHAAYDRDDILQLLLDKTKVDVNIVDEDKTTVLHLAIPKYAKSVRVLLEHGASPIIPDTECITPLHRAAQYADLDTVELVLNKALTVKTTFGKTVNLPDLKDSTGRSAFLAAVVSGKAEVVELFLKTELFDPLETTNNGKTAVDFAIEEDSPSIVTKLLDSAGPAFKPETLRRSLVWAVENKSSTDWDYNEIETQIIKLLQDREPMGLCEDEELVELVFDWEDIPLAKLLQRDNLGGMTATRDNKHRWTLEQLIGAFEPKSENEALSERNEEVGQEEKPLLPSQWDTDRKGGCVNHAEPEKSGPVLQIKYDSPYSYIVGAVLSDHPVPPAQKYYFEIEVISGSEDNLGIGFGGKFSALDQMPGWEADTWGLHGDNGGIYHAGGIYKQKSDEWKYGKGDVVGVCVDTRAQTAFYTKNGKVIDAGFANMRGRIFPMVGIGLGAVIKANF
ncbi:ankyrin, partial [Stipitochalara longipes BDJ]